VSLNASLGDFNPVSPRGITCSLGGDFERLDLRLVDCPVSDPILGSGVLERIFCLSFLVSVVVLVMGSGVSERSLLEPLKAGSDMDGELRV
jgi:hypothetical protein